MRLIVACCVGGFLAFAPQQNPVLNARIEAVIVDVSVRQNGRAVTNLAAGDFQIKDNGVRQKPNDFSVETIPLDLTLLVDASASVDAATFNGIRAVANDLHSVLLPGDRHQIVRFTTDARALGSAGALDSPERKVVSLTALFDALVTVLLQPAAVGHRRVVICLTDGVDTSSTLSYSLRATVLDRSEAVVHLLAIDESRLPGALSGPTERTAAKPTRLGEEKYSWVLRDVVDRTGGRFYDVASSRDLFPAVRAALEEFRTRYVLRYQPNGVDVTGWHEIQVTVPGKSYDIRHRRGYWRASSMP